MTPSYRFLVHYTFQKQMDSFAEAFIETNSSLWSSFIDQCRKACADPLRVGKPLARVGNQALRGRIRRLWVGGPTGHRFFFIADKAKQVTLPVYLSLEVRKNIDYDQVPWEQYASGIYSDFVKGNTQAFHFMDLPR